MPDSPATERTLLRSWKTIAAHLQVDVRTVQRWHAKTDIPIYRHGTSARSHPTAYADELDRWLTQRKPEDRAHDKESAPTGSRRWRTLAAAAGASLLVVAASALAYRALAPAPPVPFRCEVENETLSVFDEAGRLCWQKGHPGMGEPVVTAAGGAHVDATIVHDLDDDGLPEVLFNRPLPANGEGTGRLFCYGHDGQERWTFDYGRALSWEGREFGSDFGGLGLRVVEAKDRHYVLTSATHRFWFPTQVALLDGRTGRLVDEYWHPGSLALALCRDLDQDGQPEVVLAGINNPGPGLGHGAVVVLDVPFSRTPPRRGVEMSDFTGGRERAYALLPRPDLCSASGDIPIVNALAIEGGRVAVRTHCATAVIFHYLTKDLEPVEVRLSDNYQPVHARLEKEGLLDHAMTAAEQACLARVIRFPVAPNGNAPHINALWKCE